MVNLDYLYNPAAAKPIFDKNYFVDKKLGFQVIEKGTMLPHKDVYVNGKWTWGKGGIVDSNGNFVQICMTQKALILNPSQVKIYGEIFSDFMSQLKQHEDLITAYNMPPRWETIRLDEAGAKEFDILYRVHKFDGTWTDWAKNGEAIYSHGQKLNAVQIKLETKT